MKKLLSGLLACLSISLHAANPTVQQTTNIVTGLLGGTTLVNVQGTNLYQLGTRYQWSKITNGVVAIPSVNSADAQYVGIIPGIQFWNTNGHFMSKIYAWSDHDGGVVDTVEAIWDSQHNLAFAPGGDSHGGRIQQGTTGGVGQWTQFQYDSHGDSAMAMFATLGLGGNASIKAETNAVTKTTSFNFYNPSPTWVDPAWTGGSNVMTINSNNVISKVPFYAQANHLPVLRGGWLAFTVDTTPRYASLSGAQASSTETAARSPGAATAYSITNLCIYVTGLGAGTNLTVTVMTNGVATPEVVSMLGTGTAAAGCDTTHTALIQSTPNGGFVNLRIVGNNASANAPNIEWCYEVLPQL